MDRQEILSKLRERIVAFAHLVYQGTLPKTWLRSPDGARGEVSAGGPRRGTGFLCPSGLRVSRLLSFRRKVHRRGEDSQVSVDEIPIPNDDFNPLASYERREMIERLERALAAWESAAANFSG